MYILYTYTFRNSYFLDIYNSVTIKIIFIFTLKSIISECLIIHNSRKIIKDIHKTCPC